MGKLLEHRELNSGETIFEGRGFLLLLRPTQPWIRQQLNDHKKGIEASVPRKNALEGDNEGEREMSTLKSQSTKRPLSRRKALLSDRLIDPNDPLHGAIEDLLSGLSPRERVDRLDKLFRRK